MLVAMSSLCLWGFSCLATPCWPLPRSPRPFWGHRLPRGGLRSRMVLLTAAPAVSVPGVPATGSSISDTPPHSALVLLLPSAPPQTLLSTFVPAPLPSNKASPTWCRELKHRLYFLLESYLFTSFHREHPRLPWGRGG